MPTLTPPAESVCRAPGAHLHDFVRTGSFHDAHLEVCTLCGLKEIVKRAPDGSVADPRRYDRLHYRDVVQRNDPLFRKLYPHAEHA
jgi:hypothetical protein